MVRSKKKKGGKDTPEIDLRLDHIEKLLKEFSIFNNYLTYYVGFTPIPKEKLPSKFTIPDLRFQGFENLLHYVKNFISAMTSKGIDRDIFHLIFSWTFDKDVMK